MKIHLLRHGLVEKRYQHCYNGWFNPDIEVIEKKKVLELQKKIATLNVAHFVSSDLIRCQNTLKALGVTEFAIDKRVREFRFKDFIEGKRFEEFQNLTEEKDLKTMGDWIDFIKGEDLDEYQNRVEEFLKTCKNNTLICSHSGTMSMFLAIHSKRDFKDVFTGKIENLEIISLDI